MYDLFTGSGGLLDYADQEDEIGEQGIDIVIADLPYIQSDRGL